MRKEVSWTVDTCSGIKTPASHRFLGEFVSDQCFCVTIFDLTKSSILLNHRQAFETKDFQYSLCVEHLLTTAPVSGMN